MRLPTVAMPQPIATTLPPTAIPFLTTVAVANPLQQPPRQVAQNAPTALSAVAEEAADRNALWAEVEDRQRTTVNGQRRRRSLTTDNRQRTTDLPSGVMLLTMATDDGLCFAIDVTPLTVQR